MRDVQRGDARTTGAPALSSSGLSPGKQTRVGALDVQAGGGPASPANTKGDAPAPFYQYQAGTTHNSDCGPASVLAIVRMLGAEDTLKAWIVAHRPTGDALTGYLAHYHYAAASDPVGPQEELDAVRAGTTANRGSVIDGKYRLVAPTSDTDGDGVMDLGALRTALCNVLRMIGAQVPADDTLGEQALFPLASEGALKNISGDQMDEATHPNNHDAVLRFLYHSCAQDRAVIILGSPLKDGKDADGHTVQQPVAWGWGGDTPSAGGRAVGEKSGAKGGHFVIVYAFNRGTKKFTILDPSYAEAKQASPDEVLAFIANKHAGVSNMLPVSLDTVASWIPHVAPPARDAT